MVFVPSALNCMTVILVGRGPPNVICATSPAAANTFWIVVLVGRLMHTVPPRSPLTQVLYAIGSKVRAFTIRLAGGTLIVGTVTLVPPLEEVVAGAGVATTSCAAVGAMLTL